MTAETGRQYGIAFAHLQRAWEMELHLPRQGQYCDMVMVEESDIYCRFCRGLLRDLSKIGKYDLDESPAYLAMRTALYATYRTLQ